MPFKDISPEIEAIAKNYSSHELPSWLLRLQELAQQLWQLIQEILDKFFRHHGPAGGGDTRSLSSLLQYALYAAGIIAFIFLCYLLFKKAAQAKHDAASTRRGAASIEKILDSEGYRKDAERLSAAGDFKGACRALYLCLLQAMHEKSVAVFAPAKTNFEYRYLLASFPQLQKTFMQMAEIIEYVWFGNRQAGKDDYSECLRLLDLARAEVDQISAQRARLEEAEA